MAGAVLFGFLALSALTLATFAWHPLQRLETKPGQAAGKPEPRGERKRRASEPAKGEPEAAVVAAAPDEPAARIAEREGRRHGGKEKKPKRGGRRRHGEALDEESELPPIELADPRPGDHDAGEAQLDELGER